MAVQATTNFVPNPSIEVSAQHYSATADSSGGTYIAATTDQAQFGYQSVVVTVPSVADNNSGIRTDTIPATGTGNFIFSVYLKTPLQNASLGGGGFFGGGGGSTPSYGIVCTVYAEPGHVVQTTSNWTISTGPWTRYSTGTFTLPSGKTGFSVSIVVPYPFQYPNPIKWPPPGQPMDPNVVYDGVRWYADGWQLENKSTASTYCDGSQYGCNWTGAANNSASTRAVSNPTSGTATLAIYGSASAYVPGPVNATASATVTFGGDADMFPGAPVCNFDDFSVFGQFDADPALSYVLTSNDLTNDGAAGAAWTRHYMSFTCPSAFPAVNPQGYPYPPGVGTTWNTARYVQLGVKFHGVAAGSAHDIDDVQLEVVGTTGTPSAYSDPRSMTLIVKPDRINLATNPSFELDTRNWGTTGSATLSQDTTQFAPAQGLASMKITVTDSSSSATLPVSYLIPGHVYTVSMYVLYSSLVTNFLIGTASDPAAVSALDQGTGGLDIPYGAGGYGSGPYGGVLGSLPPSPWVRVFFQFTASGISDVLQVQPVASAAVTTSNPGSGWIDCVLIEDSTDFGTYFDGDSGNVGPYTSQDYLWEQGQPPKAARSYYYQDYIHVSALVAEKVADGIPYGITYTPPQYAVPYTG